MKKTIHEKSNRSIKIVGTLALFAVLAISMGVVFLGRIGTQNKAVKFSIFARPHPDQSNLSHVTHVKRCLETNGLTYRALLDGSIEIILSDQQKAVEKCS